MEINHKCCICGRTQEDLLKEDILQGAMMLAVFPTDADGHTKGKPVPLCKRCWGKFIK